MKTTPFIAALVISAFFHSQAQVTDSSGVKKSIGDDKIYQIVEYQPEFPGGEKALMEYLINCPYPADARNNGIEGSVYIRFIIEKDGNVSAAEITKGADNSLNQAALEHVKKMPAWKPGSQNGKLVRVQYIVPIRFALQKQAPDTKKQKNK